MNGRGGERDGLLSRGFNFANGMYQLRKEKRQKEQAVAGRQADIPYTTAAPNRYPYDPQPREYPPSYSSLPNNGVAECDHQQSLRATVDGKELQQYNANDVVLEPAMTSTEKDVGNKSVVTLVEGGQSRAVIPKGLAHEPANIHSLVDAFLAAYKPSRQIDSAELPYPVIIPQRRPGSRDRGFARAYAPCLAPCGISEEAFMQFHDFYDESLKYSNAIKVISISAKLAGVAPSMAATITSKVVSRAADDVGNKQSLQRSGDFLSAINQAYFIPMGLIALIMKYGNSSEEDQYAALSSAFTTRAQMNNGTTPKAAPLVFPDLDEGEAKPGFKAKFARGMALLDEHRDRKAQSTFAQEYPESQLAHAMGSRTNLSGMLVGDPNNIGPRYHGEHGYKEGDRHGFDRYGLSQYDNNGPGTYHIVHEDQRGGRRGYRDRNNGQDDRRDNHRRDGRRRDRRDDHGNARGDRGRHGRHDNRESSDVLYLMVVPLTLPNQQNRNTMNQYDDDALVNVEQLSL